MSKDIISFEVEGLREVEEALDELDKLSTRRSVGRRALVNAARPTAEIMRSLAPDDPLTAGEDLEESIGVGTRLSDRQRRLHRRSPDRTKVEAFVGAGPLPQAHLQEFGTVHHPPQPFARVAWDMDKMNVLRRIGEGMWAEIKNAVERVRRRNRG